jgi:hypothetical protein
VLDQAYAAWGQVLATWMIPAAAAAVVALLAGVALMVWGGRRRLGASDSGADEDFDAYSHTIASRLLRGLAMFVGSVLTSLGLVAAIVAIVGVVLSSR